jgi:putative DNA primase/helicase
MRSLLRQTIAYLLAKQVTPLALRADEQGRLIVPLQDADGVLHSLEFISADGAKRYLARGAKRGHFAVVGQEPAPLSAPEGPILVCEGWATGASLCMATGHTVIAAMDAGNLLPVAEALRSRFPEADLVIAADNDDKPGRTANPGVEAARKAAAATDARLAIPATPGDANDLFCAEGIEAVATLVSSAARIPQPGPTYAEPVLSVDEARASLADAIARFMEDVRHWWAGVDEPAILTPQSGEGEAAHPWLTSTTCRCRRRCSVSRSTLGWARPPPRVRPLPDSLPPAPLAAARWCLPSPARSRRRTGGGVP